MPAFALTLPYFPVFGNFWPFGVSNWVGVVRSFFSTWRKEKISSELEYELEGRLIRDALSGEPGFEVLVKAFEKMVYRVAYRFLNNENDACDVAQEVFLRVHRSLPQFRGESSLSTWIYAITANLSKNAIRSRENREKVQVLAPEDEDRPQFQFWQKVPDPRAMNPGHRAENRELNAAIQGALAQLPPDFREAVILRDLEDLEYQEIAEALKIDLGTVKSRIARGRSLLRDQLKDWL
jgi:RNA polymerase sigma-70 factor (ECF subfamily)